MAWKATFGIRSRIVSASQYYRKDSLTGELVTIFLAARRDAQLTFDIIVRPLNGTNSAQVELDMKLGIVPLLLSIALLVGCTGEFQSTNSGSSAAFDSPARHRIQDDRSDKPANGYGRCQCGGPAAIQCRNGSRSRNDEQRQQQPGDFELVACSPAAVVSAVSAEVFRLDLINALGQPRKSSRHSASKRRLRAPPERMRTSAFGVEALVPSACPSPILRRRAPSQQA